jgi:hypothetical protein
MISSKSRIGSPPAPGDHSTHFKKDPYIDLAILDVHLKDDENKKDDVGLMLAQNLNPSTEKLILTDPQCENAVRAEILCYPTLKAKVNSDVKMGGPEILLKAVEEILPWNVAPNVIVSEW